MTQTGTPCAHELWELVEQRSRRGADVATVDRAIWERFGQRRAIMFTDLAGFSRQVEQFGILHFLHVIHEQRTGIGQPASRRTAS